MLLPAGNVMGITLRTGGVGGYRPAMSQMDVRSSEIVIPWWALLLALLFMGLLGLALGLGIY